MEWNNDIYNCGLPYPIILLVEKGEVSHFTYWDSELTTANYN